MSSGKVFRGRSVLWWGTVRRVRWVMAAGMLVSRRGIVLGSQARAEASGTVTAHVKKADGFPGAGGGVGRGRRLGEGRQVCGPGP